MLCGGLIAQTSFDIWSSSPKVTEFMDTETYGMQGIFKYTLGYEFKAFGSLEGSAVASPEYTYFDTFQVKPQQWYETTTTYLQGYTTYEIEVFKDLKIEGCAIKFLGNAGHILLVVDDLDPKFNDKILHSIIKPWKIEGDIILKGKDFNGKAVSIQMDIYEYCTPRMEINQVILKPKVDNTYRRIHSPSITFKKIFIYERHGFGHLPQYKDKPIREIDLEILGPQSTIIKHIGNFAGSPTDQALNDMMGSGIYKLDSVPFGSLVASVVFRSTKTGRIRGQVKSDLIIWLKKVYCSDVRQVSRGQ